MMPTRPRPTTSGTKALLPSTLRRCLVVPAPRCIGTWKQRHSPDRVATNLATLPLLCRGGPHPYGFESCRTRQLSARCSPLPHNSGFFPLLSCVSTGQKSTIRHVHWLEAHTATQVLTVAVGAVDGVMVDADGSDVAKALSAWRAGPSSAGWRRRRCGDVAGSVIQSWPVSVTAMRAAFSSTIADFAAKAAVRACTARLLTARG